MQQSAGFGKDISVTADMDVYDIKESEILFIVLHGKLYTALCQTASVYYTIAITHAALTYSTCFWVHIATT
jgi:hypothetical protein